MRSRLTPRAPHQRVIRRIPCCNESLVEVVVGDCGSRGSVAVAVDVHRYAERCGGIGALELPCSSTDGIDGDGGAPQSQSCGMPIAALRRGGENPHDSDNPHPECSPGSSRHARDRRSQPAVSELRGHRATSRRADHEAGPTELISGLFIEGGPFIYRSVPNCESLVGKSSGGTITITNSVGTVIANNMALSAGQLLYVNVTTGAYTISGVFSSGLKAGPITVNVPSGEMVRQDLVLDVP